MIQKLVIPLIAYGVIDAFITLIRELIFYRDDFTLLKLIKIFAKVTFISGGANLNGPLWYLPTLIWIQLIMYFPARSKKKWLSALIGVMMLIAGYFVHIKWFFRVGQVPVALVFFCIGMYIKPYIIKLSQSKAKFAVLPISAVIFFITCYLNGFAEMAALNYGKNYILYIITTLAATSAILSLSMIIKNNKMLEFFGTNSLTIMCTHYHLVRFFIPYILRLMGIEYILTNYGVEILFSIGNQITI